MLLNTLARMAAYEFAARNMDNTATARAVAEYYPTLVWC